MAVQQARYGNRAGAEWSGQAIAPLPEPQRGERAGDETLAKALGWFSVGLGLAQVLAPDEVARLIGAGDGDNSRAIMRAVGLRELASGVGILTQPRPAGWLWSRVGGDLMDLALLGAALNGDGAERDKLAAATVAVLGITALDLFCSQQLSGDSAGAASAWEDRGIDVRKTITVNRPPEQLYAFWHDFQNLPSFMDHLEAVNVLDGRRSHWKAKAPAGASVEWDAEIVEDQPNTLIAWRSLEGADVENSGMVRFAPAPGGRGTEVLVELRYRPPGGVVGATIAKLFGEEPEQQVYDDLRAFKQVIETGEVVRSDASIHSHMHPARPQGE